MIYGIILALLIFIQLINILTNFKYKNMQMGYFTTISLFMIFIASFRDGIGYDFMNYKKIYELIHHYNASVSEAGVEIGYYILNKISNSYTLVVFISTTISVILKLIIIDKYSKDRLLSLLMYFSGVFITFDMGVIRQGLSIGIALFSIKYIKEKSLLKFLVIITFASLFHISSLVFLPLYFLAGKSLSRKSYYILSIVSLLLSYINFSSLIVDAFSYIPIEMVQSKTVYYSSFYTGNSTISLVKRIFFLIVFVEMYKRCKINDTSSYIFLNGYFLSVIIMGLFSSIDIIGGRGSTGLYFMQIFIFPIILTNIKKVYFRLMIFAIVIGLSIFSLLGPLRDSGSGDQRYVPYENILIK